MLKARAVARELRQGIKRALVRELEREEGLGGLVRDERVRGGRGSRGEGREGKVELPKEGGEGRRKKNGLKGMA